MVFRRIFAWIFGCALLVTACPIQAQSETAPRVMGLAQAIAYARAHQPEVIAALERVHAQQLTAAVPGAAWLPSVGATAQLFAASANNTTANYASVPTVDLPRIGSGRVTGTGTWRPYPSTLAAIGANQELFDFGRIAAQSAAEDALVEVERQRSQALQLDVTFDVEEAYFAVLAAHAILGAAEGAYERARVHRDLAQAGVSSGLRPPIELTRAEADFARFEVGVTQARGNLQISQGVYAAATGVNDPALDTENEPPAPADLPSLQAALQRAAAADPHIQALLSELRAQELRTRAIGAELRPDLSLTATLSARAGGAPGSSGGPAVDGAGWLPRVPNWDLGAVLSWPLFDGVVGARLDASQARERVQKAELSSARYQQVAAIRAGYQRVEIARTALPALLRARETAQANYAQADARFREGMGTSVELADAESVREQAEVQEALGQFSLARARAAFGRLIAEGI